MQYKFSFLILLIMLMNSAFAMAGGRTEAERKALPDLFKREVPEHSKQLRALWQKEDMLGQILKMDILRDWAGLEPGMITITDDCVEGGGAFQVPVDIDSENHLRIENNFVAGHHDGFRNMMCMGIEVENFASYRTIKFSYKTKLSGKHQLLFRIYDRTGGWIDWNIPHPESAIGWTKATLSIPPDVDRLVDIRRIGGVMFELRATDSPVKGTIYLDNIELIEECLEGIEARTGPGNTLIVGIAESRSRSGAMAELLKLVDAANLSLQTINSGQNATENAYLQLLQEDEAHGFGR